MNNKTKFISNKEQTSKNQEQIQKLVVDFCKDHNINLNDIANIIECLANCYDINSDVYREISLISETLRNEKNDLI